MAERLRTSCRKLLAAAGIASPRAGDSTVQTVDLGGGLVAEVRVVVRRAVSVDEQGDLQAKAHVALEREPFRARRCAEFSRRREFFGRGRARCSNRPVAVAQPGPGRFMLLVCSTHANRLATEGYAVVKLSRAKLAEARQRADQTEEEAYRRESEQEAGLRALIRFRAAFRDPEPVDELAERRRRRGCS